MEQLLDSVSVISRIIKISTLIILDITKTSSNNCLLAYRYLQYRCLDAGQFLPIFIGKLVEFDQFFLRFLNTTRHVNSCVPQKYKDLKI